MKAVLFLAICFIISACGLIKEAIEPTPHLITTYDIGEEVEGNIGAPFLWMMNSYKVPTYTPVKEYEPIAPQLYVGEPIVFVPGQVWIATYRTPQDGGLIIESYDYEGAADYALHITPEGAIDKGWLRKIGYAPRNVLWYETQLFEEVEGEPHVGSFKGELVYSGRDGSTIRILYREYFDGLARAAFTQELTYDLSESDTITFKSLVIEVVEANNSSIKCRVNSDDDLPWLPR